MKHIATLALMLNFGVAGVYAHQKPLKMTFSGTGGAGVIDLNQPNTANLEESEAGNGPLGSFTLRIISAETTTPQSSSTCSGSTHRFSIRVSGGGVFRFEDGSLLTVNVTEGTDCVDFVAQQAHCAMTFQITGGTGRFKNASGILAFTETVVPVLANSSGIPVYFADTGELTGTVSGVAGDDDHDDGRH